MRILHLVSYAVYSGPVPGVLALARAQRAQGHAVWVAHDTRRGPFSPYEEAVAPAHLWAEPRASDAAEPAAGGHGAPERASLSPPLPLALCPKAGPWHFAADWLRLRRLCRQDLDVVHAHLSHDHWLMAALGRVPALRIRTVHAQRVLAPRWGQKWLWRRCDGVVLRTSAHGVALAAQGAAPTLPRQCIAGGIDGQFWRPATADERQHRQDERRRLGLPAAAPLLLHVGLMAGRGQLELLRAAEQLHARGLLGPLQLAYVGLGPEQAALRRRAAASPLRDAVHFVGYLKAPALRRLYQVSDAAFLAQPGNDGAARAALEAMASGLPVLAVQTEALAALVDAVVGYPIASRAPPAIAAGLAAWLGCLARGVARGRAARRRVLRQRTFDEEARLTLQFYRRVAAARTTTSAAGPAPAAPSTCRGCATR